VGHRLEERFVNMHLRVRVDRVVYDVEELDDLRLRILLNNAFARFLVLYELAGVLSEVVKSEAGTFFIDLIRGYAVCYY